MNGQITWDQSKKTGKGELMLVWDDGRIETAEWDEPITSSTDSHDIANQFDAEFDEVTHDKDTVFVYVDDGSDED